MKKILSFSLKLRQGVAGCAAVRIECAEVLDGNFDEQQKQAVWPAYNST
jgi:hypothetical protein